MPRAKKAGELKIGDPVEFAFRGRANMRRLRGRLVTTKVDNQWRLEVEVNKGAGGPFGTIFKPFVGDVRLAH